MLVGGEIHELALELDAFHFEEQALLWPPEPARVLIFAASADRSLPGEGLKRIGAKEAGDCPGDGKRITWRLRRLVRRSRRCPWEWIE